MSGPSQSSEAPGIGNGVSSIIGVAALLAIGWVIGSRYIIAGILGLLRGEVAVLGSIDWLLPAASQARLAQLSTVLNAPPPHLTIIQVWNALSFGGSFLSIPVALMCVATGVWIYRRGVGSRYSRTMDYEGLLLEQAKSFPRIRPVLWLKGRMKDSERGAYTWLMSPWAWSVSNKIIIQGDPQTAADSFNAQAADKAFAAQLGAPIKIAADGTLDTGALAFHEQILLAVFCGRLLDKAKQADALLDDAAAGFGPVMSAIKRATSRVRSKPYDWKPGVAYEIRLTVQGEKHLNALLALGKSSEIVRDLIARCRYTRPLLASLMAKAQLRSGILTTSDMIWCKAVDRTLHYALNDVGRRVASVEAAGVRAYLMAIEAAQVDVPAIEAVASATEALQKALAESGWCPPAFDSAERSGFAG